ncbi:uncharacterized protein RCC_08724 [Ramularia collo-cygni]|uniref:F-box domain-containing protein n=1 Tax=Ramularia collo-cygni TaxID=112498 RepID=A0A2D3VKS1_9PEZI|nr:uncharacterized protein RCC_08724 [Ramularia collo-cygni]CZT23014.1 uncharacterized protein RCC_08724 [Ramularia collo-cygni]
MMARRAKVIQQGHQKRPADDGRKNASAANMAITRSATTFATIRAVTDTPELLEMILMNLSAKKTFEFQRVSKRWKATIQGSSTLQKRMVTRYYGPTLAPQSHPTMSPQHQRQMYHWTPGLIPSIIYYHASTTTHIGVEQGSPQDIIGTVAKTTMPSVAGQQRLLEIHMRYIIPKGVKNVSWGKLYITKPAIKAVTIRIGALATIDEDCINSCTAWNPSGLIWQDVLDAIKGMRSNDDSAPISIVEFSMTAEKSEWTKKLRKCKGKKGSIGRCTCIKELLR